MAQTQIKRSAVQYMEVSPDQTGRRIDNYLTTCFKGIPKTRIYQMLRKGEVRVNGSRVKPDYRLAEKDIIRVPPVFQGKTATRPKVPPPALLGLVNDCTIYEDDHLLVINKPAGVAVHAGSGEPYGIIEILRLLRPDEAFLELAHRLDKPTSGCLLLAKNHRVLRDLHNMLRDNRVKKYYLTLLMGRLEKDTEVGLPLKKNELRSGERMVQVGAGGKGAITHFYPRKNYKYVSLVRVEITTGRTHQIRVHAASIGHPVAGDEKYGDREFNRRIKKSGLRRMFLHAETLTLKLPYSDQIKTLSAPLPADLAELLRNL